MSLFNVCPNRSFTIIVDVVDRPKFSQYRYLEDYRYNYYDDVLDFLDKRSKGISRDIPRPQYWAERVIRTNRK